MTERYVPDQAAVDWARAAVEHTLARMEQHAQWLEDKGSAEVVGFRRSFWWLRRELIGGQGCVIAAFDQRLPEAERLLPPHDRATGSAPQPTGDAAPPARAAGGSPTSPELPPVPTSGGAVAHDRGEGRPAPPEHEGGPS